MIRSISHLVRPLAAIAATSLLATACAAQSAVDTAPAVTTGPVATEAASAAETGAPAYHEGPLEAGTYVVTPFAPGNGWGGLCQAPPQEGCSDAVDDSIQISFTVPTGWAGDGTSGLGLATEGNSPPGGAGLIFLRAASLHGDPCETDGVADIVVGLTADELVEALVDHPMLDVSTPVEATLDGHAGRAIDLQVPSDPTIQGSSEGAAASGCPIYRPWEPGLFAQGPDQRWHLTVLDVNDLGIVIQAMDFPDTAAQRQVELEAIVDSIEITP
jgi:hypothetical protein